MLDNLCFYYFPIMIDLEHLVWEGITLHVKYHVKTNARAEPCALESVAFILLGLATIFVSFAYVSTYLCLLFIRGTVFSASG